MSERWQGRSKGWRRLMFLVPEDGVEIVESELDRLMTIAGYHRHDRVIGRGLALLLMAVNSAQTPEESF